jgi:integrase/recombinase XerD
LFEVVRVDTGWALAGNGADAVLAAEFIRELPARGRSRHTQRSYAIGLVVFLRWLDTEDMSLGGVTRSVIVRYARNLGEREPALAPATVNHRLSVLASFFEWIADRAGDGEVSAGGGRNPVPTIAERNHHTAAGKDAPRRERVELRRRTPVAQPRGLTAEEAAALVAAAPTERDQVLLTLLWRTGIRIGDWPASGDRHGALGLRVCDLDPHQRMVRVLLKGARDEHRVPVTDDFWPLWERHLAEGRPMAADRSWAWEGHRRGSGRPLRYEAFAAMLRATAQRAGIHAHAHMFRHGLAQAIVATSGLPVAQAILGHRHLGTTAAFYARVDEPAMVAGIERAAQLARTVGMLTPTAEWVFDYDEVTLDELGQLTGINSKPKS